MARRTEIPEFGMLSGVRFAFSAVSTAGPLCGSMMADHGADVIWLEPVGRIPIERSGLPLQVDQDRKNMRSLKLDYTTPEGRETFLRLVKDLDIFLEASKGGSFDKYGLSDEVLWEANPKLIIIHMTGFGLYGDENYVKRACYDGIAQAFGGMMYANHMPGTVPMACQPMVSDFYNGLVAFGSGLAAYIKMLKTGKGESIDLCQYEANVRFTFDKGVCAWNLPADHPLHFEPSNFNGRTAGYNTYLCGDGNYVYMLVFGPKPMAAAAKIMGVEYGSEDFPAKPIYRDYDPEGIRWDKALSDFCMQHTAREVEDIMAAAGVPAICMMSYEDMLEHPHYLARESITKVDSQIQGRELYISNIVPKVKNNPGQIWRVAPTGGQDTMDILLDLGYTEEEVQQLVEKKTAELG